ncbi:hypothetical protein FPV67DRAFT_1664047 [Lyophyllum atratum]|nr:hypothetical protein FPV67DRAFT_1664047 [Lyophyllum atratum]
MEPPAASVPGSLIQPINPDTSTPKSVREKTFYLLDSRVLVALAASIFQSLSSSELKSVPKMTVQKEYPYRERLGKAAFLCQRQSEDDVGEEERQHEIDVDGAASFYSGVDYVVNPADFAVSDDDDDENSEKFVIEHDSRVGIPMSEGTALSKPDMPEAQSANPEINNIDTDEREGAIENPVEPSSKSRLDPADIAPNSTIASEVAGRGKRKRKIVEIHGLNNCECGVPADTASEDVVQCKREACETQWWHLTCIGLELAPRNWMCRTCKASGGGKAKKVARK